jgi:isopenicillin-N N-acyltransferase like protein
MPRLRLLPLLVLFLLLPGTARSAEPFRYPEGTHGKGSLKYVNSVPVLVVEGTPAEIGEQIGVLAVKPAERLPAVVKEFLKARGWEAAYPLLIKAGDGLLLRFPEASREEIEAMVKAAGLDRDLVVFVNTIFELRSVGGCSTLVVEANRSATHAPLFGRNLDGPPIGRAYEYALVTVYRQKGKQAFASIGFPGFAGVFSGMNAAGLALTMNEIHQTADGAPRFDPEGTPKFQAFRRVLEECATVEAAEKLLRGLKVTGLAALTLCDRKHGAVFEVTPKSLVVRPSSEGLCYCTNHFRSRELAVDTQCWRYESLEKSRESATLDLAAVVKHLHAANQWEWTIQTMVFEPEALKLHLAFGKGPSSALPLQVLELGPLFKGGGGKE